MSTATAIGPGGAFAARTAIFIKSTSYPSSQSPQKTTFQGLSIHDAKRGVSTSFFASGDKTAVSVKRGRGLAFEIKARKTAGASKEIELRSHLNAPKFENLAPATAYTEEAVQKFLDLPEFERTFKSECHSTQGSSSNMQTSTGSKMTRSVAKFNFADLHDVISGMTAIVKKEKGVPAIPKVPAPTPSKSTGSGKKRKALEILDLTLDDSNPAEVMHKLSVMVDTATAQISKFVEGERTKFEKASLEREKNFKEHEKVLRLSVQELTAKVAKLEGENLRCKNEMQDMMDQHAAELDDLAIDSKTSAAVSVLQAQIALVKKDPATWDVTGWMDAVFRLMGVHPDQEAGEEDPGKEDPAKEDPVKEDGATSKEV